MKSLTLCKYCLLMLTAVVPLCRGHLLNMSRFVVEIDPAKRVMLVRAEIDLTRKLGGPGPYYELTRLAPEEAKAKSLPTLKEIIAGLHFQYGEKRLYPTLEKFSLPAMDLEDFKKPFAASMTWLWLKVALPDYDGTVTFFTDPEVTIEYPLALTIGIPAEERFMTRWLESGQHSQPFPVLLPPPKIAVAADESVPDKGKKESSERPPPQNPPLPPRDTLADIIPQYLYLGFTHILPKGLDHILFVLGLFLLAIKWKPLLAQVTCFTVAHTLTLALSASGVFSLPARIVEPLIAISIVYVGLENIWFRKLSKIRLFVVFLFGLLHGMGFARVLLQLGLPKGQFLPALIFFNLGVEGGQITVLAIAFLSLGWFRDWKYFSRVFLVPGSALISTVAAYWTIIRIFG